MRSWHAPLFWIVESYRNMGLAIIPMLGVGLVAGAGQDSDLEAFVVCVGGEPEHVKVDGTEAAGG